MLAKISRVSFFFFLLLPLFVLSLVMPACARARVLALKLPNLAQRSFLRIVITCFGNCANAAWRELGQLLGREARYASSRARVLEKKKEYCRRAVT